jgi:uncharacterized OsmC-like protein
VGHARGEIELERQVLVIKRIHVTYTGVELPDGRTDAFERALAAHADGCPVARSLKGAIEVTTSFE